MTRPEWGNVQRPTFNLQRPTDFWLRLVIDVGSESAALEMREGFGECVVVKFQRIARRLIQSRIKARFLCKLRSGKRVKWRRFRCNRPARIFTNDPAQFGRLLDWAECKHYDDLALVGLPF